MFGRPAFAVQIDSDRAPRPGDDRGVGAVCGSRQLAGQLGAQRGNDEVDHSGIGIHRNGGRVADASDHAAVGIIIAAGLDVGVPGAIEIEFHDHTGQIVPIKEMGVGIGIGGRIERHVFRAEIASFGRIEVDVAPARCGGIGQPLVKGDRALNDLAEIRLQTEGDRGKLGDIQQLGLLQRGGERSVGLAVELLAGQNGAVRRIAQLIGQVALRQILGQAEGDRGAGCVVEAEVGGLILDPRTVRVVIVDPAVVAFRCGAAGQLELEGDFCAGRRGDLRGRGFRCKDARFFGILGIPAVRRDIERALQQVGALCGDEIPEPEGADVRRNRDGEGERLSTAARGFEVLGDIRCIGVVTVHGFSVETNAHKGVPLIGQVVGQDHRAAQDCTSAERDRNARDVIRLCEIERDRLAGLVRVNDIFLDHTLQIFIR